MNLSKNGAGLLVFVAAFVGMEIGEETAIEVVSAIGVLISFGLLVWNQFSRRDVKKFFFK